jgi:hypothetical protein
MRTGIHWAPRWIQSVERVNTATHQAVYNNINNTQVILTYHIADPKQHLSQAIQPEEILKATALFLLDREKLMQQINLYDLGIQIDGMEQVTQKIAEADNTPVESEGQQWINAAKAAVQQSVDQAKSEAAEMMALWPAYKKAPAAMKEHLYWETMQKILQHSQKVMVNMQSKAVLPVLVSSNTPTTAPISTASAAPDSLRFSIERPDREGGGRR